MILFRLAAHFNESVNAFGMVESAELGGLALPFATAWMFNYHKLFFLICPLLFFSATFRQPLAQGLRVRAELCEGGREVQESFRSCRHVCKPGWTDTYIQLFNSSSALPLPSNPRVLPSVHLVSTQRDAHSSSPSLVGYHHTRSVFRSCVGFDLIFSI